MINPVRCVPVEPSLQTDESSAWRLVRFVEFTHAIRPFLTRGTVVRMVHAEKEAHLTAVAHSDGDTASSSVDAVFLREYQGSDSAEKLNVMSLWEIELQDTKVAV